MKENTNTLGGAVLVTTAHKGVFFGYLDGPSNEKTIKLRKVRNCLYWPATVKGFIGLATAGPLAGSRVGPAADWAVLHDITGVFEVTVEAVGRWEAAPW
jgi:hypothetical protein